MDSRVDDEKPKRFCASKINGPLLPGSEPVVRLVPAILVLFSVCHTTALAAQYISFQNWREFPSVHLIQHPSDAVCLSFQHLRNLSRPLSYCSYHWGFTVKHSSARCVRRLIVVFEVACSSGGIGETAKAESSRYP